MSRRAVVGLLATGVDVAAGITTVAVAAPGRTASINWGACKGSA